MGIGKWLLAGGALAGVATLIHRYTTGSWWWEQLGLRRVPGGIQVGATSPRSPLPRVVRASPLTTDTRSLGEIRGDLEKKLWSDQNVATRAISTLRQLGDDLAKGYTLSPGRVDSQLRSIAQQRIAQLRARKNQAKQTVETVQNQRKGSEAQIKQLEEQIRKLSTPTVADVPKKIYPGLYMTNGGRLIEESQLEARSKRLFKQRQANIQQLRARIEMLKKMPKIDVAIKEFREASDALEEAEHQYRAINPRTPAQKNPYVS